MGRIQRGRYEDPPSGVPIYIQRPCCTNIHKSDIGPSQGTRRTIYGVGQASGSPTKSYEVVRSRTKGFEADWRFEPRIVGFVRVRTGESRVRGNRRVAPDRVSLNRKNSMRFLKKILTLVESTVPNPQWLHRSSLSRRRMDVFVQSKIIENLMR
jgi:hypothetical protein